MTNFTKIRAKGWIDVTSLDGMPTLINMNNITLVRREGDGTASFFDANDTPTPTNTSYETVEEYLAEVMPHG